MVVSFLVRPLAALPYNCNVKEDKAQPKKDSPYKRK